MEKEVSTHLIKCQTPLGKDCPSTPRICTMLPAKRHHIPPQPIRTVLKLSVPKSGQFRCMLRTIQRNVDSLGHCSQHSCGQAGMRHSWTLLCAPCAAPDPSSVSLCRWLSRKQEGREEEGFLFPDSVGCVQGMRFLSWYLPHWLVSLPNEMVCAKRNVLALVCILGKFKQTDDQLKEHPSSFCPMPDSQRDQDSWWVTTQASIIQREQDSLGFVALS